MLILLYGSLFLVNLYGLYDELVIFELFRKVVWFSYIVSDFFLVKSYVFLFVIICVFVVSVVVLFVFISVLFVRNEVVVLFEMVGVL